MSTEPTTELNALTEQEQAAGWRLLFDGQDPSRHWRGYKKQELPSHWRIDDGALYRAEKGGDIITRDQFDDLELSIEWRISDEGNGNSGIFFRVSEDRDHTFETGPEFQVLNDAKHPDNAPECMTGGNYALHAPTRDMARPVGEWNHTRILVKGPHVEHWLNGEKVVEYELWSDDWETRVANSKFGKMPGYGRNKTGHLALQDHGDPVWYRNIKVRTL